MNNKDHLVGQLTTTNPQKGLQLEVYLEFYTHTDFCCCWRVRSPLRIHVDHQEHIPQQLYKINMDYIVNMGSKNNSQTDQKTNPKSMANIEKRTTGPTTNPDIWWWIEWWWQQLQGVTFIHTISYHKHNFILYMIREMFSNNKPFPQVMILGVSVDCNLQINQVW